MPAISRNSRVLLLLLALGAFVWMAHRAYVGLPSPGAKVPDAVAPAAPAPAAPLALGAQVKDDLAFEGLDAKAATMGDFRGKVVLINFWAGWCAPCLHEMPGLFALQKAYAARGFVVLGVNMDDKPEDGLRALKRAAGEAPFRLFKGASSNLADVFGIEGLPYSVLIDKQSRITYARAGEIDWAGDQARKMIEALL